MIPIALGISVLMFALLTLAPGDPVDLLISSDPRVKPEDVVRLKHLYGLDQPIHIRYLKWLGWTGPEELGLPAPFSGARNTWGGIRSASTSFGAGGGGAKIVPWRP